MTPTPDPDDEPIVDLAVFEAAGRALVGVHPDDTDSPTEPEPEPDGTHNQPPTPERL